MFDMKKVWVLCASWAMLQTIHAQTTGYQKPPKVMEELAMANPTPDVRISSNTKWMIQLTRASYPTVEEIGQPEIRVAGLRINPNNFSPSRSAGYTNITLFERGKNQPITISGLPQGGKFGGPAWNNAETKFAFLHYTNTAVNLYMVDVATKKAIKLNTLPLNTITGSTFQWLQTDAIVYKAAPLPASKAPVRNVMPFSPAIQESKGKAAPSVTYQDLIKTPYDEQLFEFYATCHVIHWQNGVSKTLFSNQLITTLQPSPNEEFWLVRTIQKPFSYLVPFSGFASQIAIHTQAGNLVQIIAKLPSLETRPSGYDNVQNVPSNFDWRDDVDATLVYTHPLDSGLIKNKVPYRDAVLTLQKPFNGQPDTLCKVQTRFRGVQWGNASLALVYEGLTSKQTSGLSVLNPTDKSIKKIVDRNTTDAYGFMGNPVTTKNKYGRNTVFTTNNNTQILLNNTQGSSPKGDLPFLASYNLIDKKMDILWRCAEGSFEFVADVLDADKLQIITRRETATQPANYILKNLKLRTADVAITNFTSPYKALEGVTKQKVTYKRADGVDLSGDLYLPAGYTVGKDAPLPVVVWAYPREYNSAADAAQIRGSQHQFTNISWATPVYFVTQGFAVLDNAEMPIVAAAADKKPNDNFVEQLKLNAEAAIQKLSSMGVGDSTRVAVGGHSYGAFMTANLLAHTKLFKAGIARSGAYNRTLTPFGFQNEERTYWQAPKLYYEMSPFSYADKIKTPLLLIHGDSDDNPGTYPINSERLFNAIKGNGGTARYVSLPYEAHSYRGKENILHMLYEMNQWLQTHVAGVKK